MGFPMRARPPILALLPIVLFACAAEETPPADFPPPPQPPPAVVAAPAPPTYSGIDRAAFNRAAVRLNLPLYWTADKDQNRTVSPDEVASLLFYPTEGRWVEGGAFT